MSQGRTKFFGAVGAVAGSGGGGADAAVPTAFWLWFAFLWFLHGLALRLYIAAGLEAEPLAGLLLAILVGFFNDLQVLMLMFGFLGLGFFIAMRLAPWCLGIVFAVAVLMLASDFFYWMEFQSRFSPFVIQYVKSPRQVLSFIHEQFYLGLFALPILILIGLAARWIARRLPQRIGGRDRAVCALWILLGVVVAAVGAPLGEAGHSRHLHQLGTNGYLGMLVSARLDERVWRNAYWQPRPTAVADSSANGGAQRSIDRPRFAGVDRGGSLAIADGAEFRHVVLIIEESLGGKYWRDPQLRRLYMPRIQALAKRGLSFESVYATGSITIRGLEAILNGYPPLPGVVVTTEPRLETMPSLPRELGRAGFHTLFVYGGSPWFTNFQDYWRRLGYDEILSRRDFDDGGFETSWGVADEILFDKMLGEMDRLAGAHQRVMLTTLTVSNHRPFDFPEGRIDLPASERRREHVIAYADWALGKFLEDAERHPWFDHTLFVVAVDHGPIHEGPALVPAVGYRVPLVFYSPGQLPPQVIEHHGSTMSVATTLMDLLNIAPVEPFYGRSLLRGDGPVPVAYHYDVGLLAPDRLTVLVRGGGVLGWRFDGDALIPSPPDFRHAGEAEALYRSAHERLFGAP